MPHKKAPSAWRSSLFIVVIYFFFSVALLSNGAIWLGSLIGLPPDNEKVEGTVGLVYLGTTSVFIFTLFFRRLKALRNATVKLEQQEKDYRILFEANPQPMWVYDLETKRFIAVNEATVQRYGYTRDEFGEMTTDELYPKEETCPIVIAEKRTNAPAVEVYECRHCLKDGTLLYVEIKSNEIEFRGKRAGLTLAKDITERKRRVQEIEEQQKWLETVLDMLPVPLMILEPNTARVIFANKAAGALAAGTFLKYIFGEPLNDEYFCTDAEGNRMSAEETPSVRAAQGEELDWSPMTWYTPNGELSLIVNAEKLDAMFGHEEVCIMLCQDISFIRESEKQLRLNEERFRTVARATSDAVWDWNLVDDTIWWNEGFYDLFGYTPEEIEETVESWYTRIHDDDKERVVKGIHEVIDSGEQYWNDEYRFYRKDGSIAHTFDRGFVIHDHNNKPVRMIGGMMDISDKKQHEEDLREINESLERRVEERTEQLQAINKELESFSYSVSHDLRAPLRHINGFCDLLCKSSMEMLDEKGQRYLTIISQSTKQMGTMIDELLSFSRIGRTAMQKAVLDLNIIVKQEITDLAMEVGEREIDWQLHPLPTVRADRTMLRLVVMNLLTNAIKYSRNIAKTRIEIGPVQNNGMSGMYVKDNGAGFDMKYYDKMFGLFQRLHRADEFEGTGIGLANVLRIMQRHDGKVWAESEPGKGATFYFELPTHIEEETDGTQTDSVG